MDFSNRSFVIQRKIYYISDRRRCFPTASSYQVWYWFNNPLSHIMRGTFSFSALPIAKGCISVVPISPAPLLIFSSALLHQEQITPDMTKQTDFCTATLLPPMSETLKTQAVSKEDAFLFVCSILLDQILNLQINMHVFRNTQFKRFKIRALF